MTTNNNQGQLPFELSEFDFSIKASPKAKSRNSSLKYDCIVGMRTAGKTRKFNIYDIQLTRFFARLNTTKYKSLVVGTSAKKNMVVFAFDNSDFPEMAMINHYTSKRGNTSQTVSNKGMVTKIVDAIIGNRQSLWPVAPDSELRIFCNLTGGGGDVFRLVPVQLTLKDADNMYVKHYDSEGRMLTEREAKALFSVKNQVPTDETE